MNKKFKFSVVIPIYNVEKYLEESVKSVINQDIGFKENIQLILVNDASPDNSEEICLKYKEMYPKNVVYIKKENGGVSSARNEGIKYIEGEYVSFLDSDDKWESNVFSKAYKMFEKYKNIDVIGVRQKFFEASEDYHVLDYKFTDDKIINIFNTYDHIQLSVTSAIIRSSAIENARFDTKLKYAEDVKFLAEIILKKERIGYISSSLHLYRKRIDNSSALDKQISDETNYIDVPEKCLKYLFDLSKEKYGCVIPYIQYTVMYILGWVVRANLQDKVKEGILKDYKERVKEFLQDIDDYIIAEQKFIQPEHKTLLVSFKYGFDIRDKYDCIKHKLYYNNIMFVNFFNENLFKVCEVDFKGNKVRILGSVIYLLNEKDYDIYLITNRKEKIKLNLFSTELLPKYFLGEKYNLYKGFDIEIPIENLKYIKFQVVYKKNYKTFIPFIISTLNSKIDTNSKIYYRYKNKLMYYDNDRINFISARFKNRLKMSYKLFISLLKDKKFNVIKTRFVYHICKKLNKKSIWLISDRIDRADDNGEHLFKYINSINDKNIKAYFVIDKKTTDYKRMKEYGKVVNYNSFKHKILFLLSNQLISSQAEGIFLNLFDNEYIYYHDLYNYKFTFLQHGITEKDLSSWINIFTKKIDLFVCAAKKEYESIINNKNYGYKEENVILTGFARYDNLTNKPKKEIAIMPTWRAFLAGLYNPETQRREYSKKFNSSEYFKFYSKLINDEDIINILNEKGYKAKFYLHPNHYANSDDFIGNDTIEVVKVLTDYQKVFGESSLLVTDYSSVAFDFAYLNKPVIYTQFDIDSFYEGQVYDKGYFEYDTDGFGPVCYDYNSTKNAIINVIKKGFKQDKKYEKRIKEFFMYTDKNNCKRIYDEIKNIDN